jgi:DNA mismatch repair protein MutS2
MVAASAAARRSRSDSLMDAHSLERLGFPRIRQWLIERARSSMARERIEHLGPMTDADRIRTDLARTAEMMDALASRMPPPLDGLHDVRGTLRKAELSVLLDIDALRQVRDVCDLAGRVVEYRGRVGVNHPVLKELLSPIQDLRHVTRAIDVAIDERGKVRDSASPELTNIRRELAAVDEKILNELRRLIRSGDTRKALRYSDPTVHEGHHVLAVAVNFRHLVPGIVHRTSATGETLFIEPARVAEIAAGSASIRNAEEREIRRILRQLTATVGNDSRRILSSIHTLVELDFTRAKADWCLKHGMKAPVIGAGRGLRLLDARHPHLLELAAEKAVSVTPVSPANTASGGTGGGGSTGANSGETRAADATRTTPDANPSGVVPITVRLGEDYDLLVITGPNTGGKTVAIKTVGTLAAMALAGIPIPAGADSRVPVLADILVDVGDEQSIEQSLSTFSGHVTRIAHILEVCHENTLVLLDELGSGTDPTEGSALGRAILDEVRRKGALGMVTTHLGDLKTYALSRERVENAAVEFDVKTLRPTYRLLVGQFGRSCALTIARRLKLPKQVIKRAGRYFDRKHGGKRGRDVEEVQRLREEAEKARLEAIQARTEADQAAEQLRRKALELQHEASVSAELEKARLTLRAGDEVRVKRFDKVGVVKRVDTRRKLVAVTVGNVEWELPMEELIPSIVRRG